MGDSLFWGAYAKVYDGLLNFPSYQKLVEQVEQELINSGLGKRVLDAGTGTGNFALRLGRAGFEVVGIDNSDEMLKRAESKRKKEKLGNVHFEKGDLERRLNFPNNAFDHVVCVHTLYTLSEPSTALSEFYRILNNPGQLTMAEFQHPIQLIPVIKEEIQKRGFWKTLKTAPYLLSIAPFNLILQIRQKRGKYHYWTKEEFRHQLEMHGFRISHMQLSYTNNWDILSVSRKSTIDFKIGKVRIMSAKTEEDKNSAFRIRHKIYCDKLKYKPPQPDGRECDEYDTAAIHAIALDEQGNTIGTIRIILDNPIGLPIETQPEWNIKKYREENKYTEQLRHLDLFQLLIG